MARKEQKQTKRQRKRTQIKSGLPFSKKNYQIFGIGVILIVIGYIFMMQGPVDSFMSLTLSPIILVLAYLVVIPYSILYREKSSSPEKIENP